MFAIHGGNKQTLHWLILFSQSDADGKLSVKFGVLFQDDKCTASFVTLVGTLKAAVKGRLLHTQESYFCKVFMMMLTLYCFKINVVCIALFIVFCLFLVNWNIKSKDKHTNLLNVFL